MLCKIALSGKCGSGKDVVGLYLKKKYGFEIKRLAHSIKLIVSECTNTSLHDNYYYKKKYPTYDKNFPTFDKINLSIAFYICKVFGNAKCIELSEEGGQVIVGVDCQEGIVRSIEINPALKIYPLIHQVKQAGIIV